MHRANEIDSGWVGAGPDDDLDRQLLEEDDDFDRSRPHVMTALGPVEPGALGPALAAEMIGGLALAPAPGAPDGRHQMLAELEDVYSSGIRAMAVEERLEHLPVLHWLAGRVQPHLVLLVPPEAAGVHAPPPEIGGLLVTPRNGDDPGQIAHQALATGLPVRIAAGGNADAAVTLARALEAAGVDGGVISISGIPSAEAMRVLAGCGASIVVQIPPSGAGEVAARVADLASAGFGDRLAVATGIVETSGMLAHGGAPGFGWGMEAIPLLLMDAGMDALAVRALFIDNPARMLTITRENQ
jgi:hypothetical protein